jgi:hypothetical protein
MVASKYSRNHFISEKYKSVPAFALHFLQNSPLVQLQTFAKAGKGVGNFSGSHFV